MTTLTKDRPKASKVSVAAVKAALRAVDPAVPAKAAKPSTKCVLLDSGTLTATDGDLRITVLVDYYGPPMLVPYDRLKAIVGNVPDKAEVTFTVDGTSARVRVPGGSWTFPVEAVSEFPAPLGGKAFPVARIPADQFVRAVNSTALAIDKGGFRAAMSGVLLDVRGDEINFVGTDGRRVCVVECGVEQAVDDTLTVCPDHALKAAAKMAERTEGAVQIESTRAVVVVSAEQWRVETRVVDGTFPDWRAAFPDRDVTQTVVDREALRQAVAVARVCADEVSRGVTMRLGASVRLSAKSSTNGEANVTCPVVEAGDEVAVTLDPRYVLEWLESLSGKDADPTVTIDAASAESVVIFRCDDATNLVMPLDPT